MDLLAALAGLLVYSALTEHVSGFFGLVPVLNLFVIYWHHQSLFGGSNL